MPKYRLLPIALFLALCFSASILCAQEKEFGIEVDIVSNATVALPSIFKPNIDLSGRGFSQDKAWPQELAAEDTLQVWEKEIGFSGFYRLQYNLWYISQLSQDKEAKEKILAHYEARIKKINDAGGIVILDLFGTPAGMGTVLDKRSPPTNQKAFKDFVKATIRELSCNKRYRIWYEVWSAPDLDEFFLGKRQEYLMLYKSVAEVVKELEEESKIYIPLGGPSTSWWFQDFDGNTIVTPEKSLIYELIKFCYKYKLPLDFITWHAYSTDPKAEKEVTRYNKNPSMLIRDWLSYFHFEENIPLIIDEWNYDRRANLLPERAEKACMAASYIPARLAHMYTAGITHQMFFSLEDFYNTKDNVVRNVGIFAVAPSGGAFKTEAKVVFNIFKMLTSLGSEMYVLPKNDNEFTGAIATKSKDSIAILIFNYIDPEIFLNYLSRNISSLGEGERRAVLGIVKSKSFEKIKSGETAIETLRVSPRVKNLLKKAQELYVKANKWASSDRNVKLVVKNLKDSYQYAKYIVDSSCSKNCALTPTQEKEIAPSDIYQETLTMKPYSVTLVVFTQKPPEAKPPEQAPLMQGALNKTTEEAAPKPKTTDNNAASAGNATAVLPAVREANAAGTPKKE
ncbi:MAG: hypothetical protein C4540_01200 [Candidatus Omnitrophota bacterium]|jgi:hypothetical protein|nr:MAG: hypothetical protein C4540_01200 [Candidatus Omnitrophota bacterium]